MADRRLSRFCSRMLFDNLLTTRLTQDAEWNEWKADGGEELNPFFISLLCPSTVPGFRLSHVCLQGTLNPMIPHKLSLWPASKRAAAGEHLLERDHLPWPCAGFQMTWKDLFTSLKMNYQVIRPTLSSGVPTNVCPSWIMQPWDWIVCLIPQRGSVGWRPRLSPCRFWDMLMDSAKHGGPRIHQGQTWEKHSIITCNT